MKPFIEFTEFKPLESVTLPDLGELECSGLVLVVGPNSSGKSQLLKDIYKRLSGEPSDLVVAKDIKLGKPPEYDSFIETLKQSGYFETFEDENGAPQMKPLTTYIGSGQTAGQIQPNQAKSWHDSFTPSTGRKVNRRVAFLNYFGRFFVTELFLERRLIATQEVGLVDFEKTPPQNDLHCLYLDGAASKELSNEINESFGKSVWPDPSRGTVLCLRVNEGGAPPAEERIQPRLMATYRQIESEGDGLKSYVATCIALMLGSRPVCLIDEPEMCLHPPQAYKLGRFIGNRGVSTKAVTFVSTHSSQILRGVVQTAKNIQIVRLTNSKDKFKAHLVPADILSDALTRPSVRAESVLDGIFAQSVIVVESDGDRLVYQTVLESLSAELNLDVHLATVGGISGITYTCKLYRTLKIPVVVVADLDMITDKKRLCSILEIMTTKEKANALSNRAKLIMDEIKTLSPTVNPQETWQQLKKLVASEPSWNSDEDIELKRKLNQLINQLDRQHRLKRGGVDKFPATIADPLRILLSDLEECGIFLVPVGELEGWLSESNISVSKETKWAWANAAAIVIQKNSTRKNDIWDFIRKIGNFLSK